MTGVLTLDEAMKLVFIRTRLINQQIGLGMVGSLLAVRIAYDDAIKYVDSERLSIAAVNGPSQCVFAGNVEAISELKSMLTKSNYKFKQLEHTFPFHSHMLTPSLLSEFREAYQSLNIQPRSPKIPFVSTVTGDWCDQGCAIDVDYWCYHIRQTVLWHQAIQTLDRSYLSSNSKDDKTIYFECALSNVLTNVTKTSVQVNSSLVLSSILLDTMDVELSIKKVLGTVWCYGLTCIDYKSVYGSFIGSSQIYKDASFISMPGHVFNRQRHWIDPVISNWNKTNFNSVNFMLAHNDDNDKTSSGAPKAIDSSTLIDKLIEIYISVIGNTSIDARSDFFAFGGDSHSALILISRINQLMQMQLSVKDIMETPIVEQLAARIEQIKKSIVMRTASQSPVIKPSDSIYFLRHDDLIIMMKQGTSSSRPPIFVIAPTGGTCFIYKDLCKYLDATVTVLAMKYPEVLPLSAGEYRYDADNSSVANLASYYIRILRSVLLDATSYTLLGTSFGGMIGYEISQQLSALSSSNVNISRLFMIDTPTKNSLRVHFHETSNEKVKAIVFWTMFGAKHNFSLDDAENVCAKDDEEMKQFCINRKILSDNSGNFDLEFLELRRRMHIFELNVRAIENYPLQPMRSRVTQIFYFQVKSPLPNDPIDPHQDWSQVILPDQFNLFYVDGHHLSVNYEPFVQQLATLINKIFLSSSQAN